MWPRLRLWVEWWFGYRHEWACYDCNQRIRCLEAWEIGHGCRHWVDIYPGITCDTCILARRLNGE